MTPDPTPSPTPEESLVMAEPIESAGDGIKRLRADLALAQDRYAAAERTVREQREALERVKKHLEAQDVELNAMIPNERIWVSREILRPALDIVRAALAPDTEGEGT